MIDIAKASRGEEPWETQKLVPSFSKTSNFACSNPTSSFFNSLNPPPLLNYNKQIQSSFKLIKIHPPSFSVLRNPIEGSLRGLEMHSQASNSSSIICKYSHFLKHRHNRSGIARTVLYPYP